MRRFAVLFCLIFLALPALAQPMPGPVPDKRLAISRDVDFPGGDLRALFDSDFEACARACLTDPACTALTFNTRSNACFPKAAATGSVPYQGALSARVLRADPAVLDGVAARVAELDFLRPEDLAAARMAAEALSRRHHVNERPIEDWLQAATEARAAGRIAEALGFTGAALVLADTGALWAEYARLTLAQPAQNAEARRNAQTRALSAAINAHLRSAAPATRAQALVVMAEALEAVGRGRETVPALRLAQALAPREDIAERLDAAIAKHGFRVVETEVESDAPSPRICTRFSEPLARGADFAPFVQLPQPGLAVTTEDDWLCVAGLRHGESYRLTLRPGLPAQSGEVLARPVELTQYVRDRRPSVRFPGRAYVLPRTGEAALPVVSVNTDRLDLRLHRMSDRNLLRAIQDGYFGRPLSPWQEDAFSGDMAEQVWAGTGEVGIELNRDVTTRLPLAEAIAGLPAGIYALHAAIPGADPYDRPAATQWFVLSDLGLATMAGTDGLHVFVRSLASAEPKAGVTVSLMSRANRVLGTAVTDAAGHAQFPAGLMRGQAGAAPALVTVQEGEGDLAFLSLTEPEFDLSDRGVEGRPPAPPIDVFLTTERGAYHAGETVRATALARDGRAEAVEGLPLTAILTRPDGVEHARALSPGGVAGGHVLALGVAATAPRGTWTLAVHAEPDAPPLATQKLLVEDFLPERIDFELSLAEGPLRLSDRPVLGVAARYLFGAVGADLAIEGEVRLAAVDSLPAHPGFRFGRHDSRVAPQLAVIENAPRTDAEGRAVLPLAFPGIEAEGKPLEAEIVLRLAEGSARPVERRLTRALAPDAPLIGIRPLFDGVVGEGAEAGFELLGLGPDGTPQEMRIDWALNRVETRYQWYQMHGDWAWEPVTTRSRVTSGEVVLEGGRFSLDLPVQWGRYELVVTRADAPFAETSVAFDAGWYAPADTSRTPDMLEVALDKPAYAPGETATLRIVPRAPGKGLVTVMSNRLIHMQPVDLVAGENTVALPVTDEWGAGAYVAATLIRPMDAEAGQNPARALGLAHATVDPGPRRLRAGFELAAEAQPRAPLDVALKVEGIRPGETAHATIAAVDLGILNLTGFASPDPDGHYFGQRRLGMGLRDVYGRLIDGMSGEMGRVRSGGDAGAGLRMQAPPPTEDLVALFEGPVQVGPDGYARARFDLPAFNGTVRLMAVVWSKTGLGQAEADILVRDPVVLTASLPRFLAPGDRSRLLLEIVHATGPAGRMGLSVTGSGVTLDAAAIPPDLELAEGGKATLSIPVIAGEPGLAEIAVTLTTPDDQTLTRRLALPVEVTDPEVLRTSRFTLADGDRFTADQAIFSGFLPGTGRATLAIGPIARLDAAGLLAALDRYPYGCTEQVASAALPLLYLDEIAVAMGLGAREDLRARVDQAIAAVLANQAPNGSFGLWRPDAGDFWLDAYVTDFLSRARANGFAVPTHAFRAALDNLRNRIAYAPDFDEGGEDIAYALMVLAREGAAAMADLRYYADVKGRAFATPLAAGQLGAALAAYGDPVRAEAMFTHAAGRMGVRIGAEEPPLWRADYGTDLRDAAGLLALAAEAGSAAVDRTMLADYVAAPGRARSTQEAAWTLLAAHALIDRPGAAGFTLNGAPLDGPLVRLLRDGDAPAVIGNGSGADEVLTLTAFGVPEVPEPAGGNGFAITRRHYTLDGAPATLDAVPAGTRLVTVIEVTPFAPTEARLMVADPLPAGFEIDNPNLIRAGDIRALDWLDVTEDAAHTEARQDRFLAAVDLRSDAPIRLAYILRATAPGSYRHPAASVEDMYRSDRRAWTDAGRATVSE
ncbi:alpha-2-macroglobulin family protein [Rhodovulum tesquicola]|uniref:alpha-2-macroglobulin family protein n=1 Tax=Rhodovulum tesquicola TaxID=540254 RepID=UPI0020976519|nr:alpha-2-macroglobulin family protein [Rhodovulum tesquicola]MCO8143657.1 alpha-2-macroglobulin family protein [Rhodovulum tesquicola]